MAKEYLLSSLHVHTKLCDGKNTPEELALSAWKAGLKTLGFSGHSHTPHDIEYCMTNARTQLYRAQVAKLKERYAGKLDILCGLEWDLYSDDDPAAYDYWIGSAHYVKGPKTGKYYEIDWREADLAACIQDDFDGDGLAVVETYFANVAAVAAKKPTILGHFDLIKKVNGSGKFFDESALYRRCPQGTGSRCTGWLRAGSEYQLGLSRLPRGLLSLPGHPERMADHGRQCDHYRRCPRSQGPDLWL